MKWKEMSALQKYAVIIGCLSMIASITLTILDATKVFSDTYDIGDILLNIVFLAYSVLLWKQHRNSAIVFSALGGIGLLCDIIFLFV